MRQGSNTGRRPRGRTNRKQHGGGGGGGGGGQPGTRTFDSNGPDGRVRGNARQVYEKYLTLARDATSAGDRVAAEAYYQHAEHYFRILSDSTDPTPSGRRPDDRQPQHFAPHDEGYYGGDEDDDQPVNGHGGRQRPYDARGNGNQPQRDHQRDPQRDHEPRDAQRQPQPHREHQPHRGEEPREAPRQPQPAPAPAESAAAAPAASEPAAESRPQGASAGGAPTGGDGEAARPRRGRPRKPRTAEDGEPRSAESAVDSSPETESGPAVS